VELEFEASVDKPKLFKGIEKIITIQNRIANNENEK
jgi:hypothetical protein